MIFGWQDNLLGLGHLTYFLLCKSLAKPEKQQIQHCVVVVNILLKSNSFLQEQTTSHLITYFYMHFPSARLGTESVCDCCVKLQFMHFCQVWLKYRAGISKINCNSAELYLTWVKLVIWHVRHSEAFAYLYV